MADTLSVAEAKAHLSQCLRRVEQGEALLITRHGEAVAALVPAADLDQLTRLRQAGPACGLTSLAGGWEGSEELAVAADGWRRTATRRFPALT